MTKKKKPQDQGDDISPEVAARMQEIVALAERGVTVSHSAAVQCMRGHEILWLQTEGDYRGFGEQVGVCPCEASLWVYAEDGTLLSLRTILAPAIVQALRDVLLHMQYLPLDRPTPYRLDARLTEADLFYKEQGIRPLLVAFVRVLLPAMERKLRENDEKPLSGMTPEYALDRLAQEVDELAIAQEIAAKGKIHRAGSRPLEECADIANFVLFYLLSTGMLERAIAERAIAESSITVPPTISPIGG